ncbi:hypothetical protein HPB52_016545 [Rhipicephalus sanguineus]|uniref:DDE-1 domain-containing protein n=1 Tax=Rhipicephalus sanguineus TaxID=34632 RepID=A0A9D4SUQ6_RHISA|nr:hypothetical protein HPB52_016545 [Rhipicephalus sanguineus]
MLYVPAGRTSILQPADVYWNKPLKSTLRHLWEQYMREEARTPKGNLKKPSWQHVLDFVAEAWAAHTASQRDKKVLTTDRLCSVGSGPNGDRVAATQSNIGSAEAPQGPVSMPRYRSVALLTLQVPTYAGDLRQWREFWDHYSATIHKNSELPPIEKFKYLLTYLTGAAKRAIKGIRLADNNYDIAVKTLKERFGRQELLVNEHIEQLLALSPVRSSKEVEKLRMLHDAVRFHVSALEGLGVPPDQYTVVLNRVLMRCLPEDLAILYRQKKKEESTQDGDASAQHTTPEARMHKATDILSFLKIQVEVREEGKQAAPSSHPCHSTMVPDDMNSLTRSVHAIPSASALVATEPLQQRTLSCVLCNSRAHSLTECTAEMSVEEKKARLRNSRCCYRCGTRNHVAQFC